MYIHGNANNFPMRAFICTLNMHVIFSALHTYKRSVYSSSHNDLKIIIITLHKILKINMVAHYLHESKDFLLIFRF